MNQQIVDNRRYRRSPANVRLVVFAEDRLSLTNCVLTTGSYMMIGRGANMSLVSITLRTPVDV